MKHYESEKKVEKQSSKEKATEIFIESVKNYKSTMEMTQKELASFLGVSTSTIRRWECGESMPPLNEVIRIAGCLGASVEELLTGVPRDSVDIHRETGLSKKAIHMLKETKHSGHMFKIIDQILSAPRYVDDSLALNDIVSLKAKMYSGECAQDGSFGITRNAIRGIQWELINAYGELIDSYTDMAAKKRLKKEGKRILTKDEMLGYTDYDDQTYYDDEDDPTVNDEDFAY